MAQHSLKYDTAQVHRKVLDLEKLGVIAGFLFGLPIGIALMEGPLVDANLPQWLAVSVIFTVVALSTWLGLKVGSAAGECLEQDTDH